MKRLLLSLFVLMLMVSAAMAQNRTVTGTVVSESDGLPLPGVTVMVKGTSIGSNTDVSGKFSVEVPSGSNTLVFTFIGFTSKELQIPTDNVMNVSLETNVQSLDQVVVTAGGVKIQKREQGNQATTIRAEELTQGKSFNVASSLTGKVAGLQVNAVGGGVNPDIRLVLRGNRSLLGNNQALVVVDNVIVPPAILGNLNPQDIEAVQVLNGAGAAALYGSDASNGALIITTKKGRAGETRITFSQTTTLESVSFLPEVQKRFGSGTTPDAIPTYTPFENQQYGPAFDGTIRPIGKPLEDGSIQEVPYSPRNDKNEFWDTGLANQSDISLTTGTEKGSMYFSAQYLSQTAAVPGDKYNRFNIRVNGVRELKENFTLSYTTNYVQNRYDISTALASAFNNVMMTPAQVPLLRYDDWKTDPYANPNGFYNEYYDNPYFTLDNNRQKVRNDYLTGSAQVKWFPVEPLSLLFRVSIATRNVSNKSWSNRFDYSDYTLANSSAKSASEFRGAVSDGSSYYTQLNPEFQAQFKKDINEDFSINALVGASVRDNNSKIVNVNSSGMAIPGLFNIGNTTQREYGLELNFRERQIGVYGDIRASFRDYLYLHVSGRNDWRSVLAKENRSIFYPAADLSFIASEAIPAIKNSKVFDVLKLRGGVSKVGNVNIGPYSLVPTFAQAAGYPYSGTVGYSLSSRVVTDNLKPEETTTIEAGVEFSLLKGRIFGSFTAYKSNTVDQTVPIQITPSSGYTSFLTNTGEVSNEGIESTLHFTPLQTLSGWSVTLGGNFTYNDNQVISLFGGDEELRLGSFGAGSIYAVPGEPFPMLKGTKYIRNNEGKIIVDALTGNPTVSQNLFQLGRTEPTHRLGLDLEVNYKGFRLAALAEYRGGNTMFNQSSTELYFSGAGIRTTDFNRERFVVPNSVYDANPNPDVTEWVENTNITTNTGGANFWTNGPTVTGVAENFTYSAAFWKLREVSLSYDLPSSVLERVGFVKAATISVQGRNLMLLTPDSNVYIDPEYSAFSANSNVIGITGFNDAPPARYYGMTLSITL